jgi:hypothetical protein
MIDVQKILDLKHGESVIVSHSPCDDCGVAEIWYIHDTYLLFSIPMFGGQPIYEDDYRWHRINEMVEKIESWS